MKHTKILAVLMSVVMLFGICASGGNLLLRGLVEKSNAQQTDNDTGGLLEGLEMGTANSYFTPDDTPTAASGEEIIIVTIIQALLGGTQEGEDTYDAIKEKISDSGRIVSDNELIQAIRSTLLEFDLSDFDMSMLTSDEFIMALKRNLGGIVPGENVTDVNVSDGDVNTTLPENVIVSGTFGIGFIKMTWALTADGTFYILGKGLAFYMLYDEMYNPPWQNLKSSINKVIIGNGVYNVPINAFAGCANLTEITIPDSVTKIEDSAFAGCTNLTEITIPDSVTEIGDSAFAGCANLTEITIPDSVTEIGDSAFAGCANLTEITIPDSVTEIGDSAFAGCTNLTEITIPGSVTRIAGGLFHNCESLTAVTIPNSVTKIGSEAFYGCLSLENITIPASVVSMERDYFDSPALVFAYCASLQNINVEEGNENYCSVDGVLYNKLRTRLICYPAGKSGASYTIQGRVTEIEDYAFLGCALLRSILVANDNANYVAVDGVLYNKNKTELFCYPAGKNATSFSIPNGVKTVGLSAFEGNAFLENVTIPDSVTYIKKDAFLNCSSLEKFTVDKNNRSYCSDTGVLYSLSNKQKRELLYYPVAKVETIFGIPSGVMNIGQNAFNGSERLSFVTVPDSVTTIAYGAFADCTSLVEIALPESVISIDSRAFYDCESLSNVFILNSDCSIYGGKQTIDAGATIHGDENSTAQTYATKWNRKFVLIPPPHIHTYEAVVTVPTCTKGGYTTYTCSECSDRYITDETLPLGHFWLDWIIIKDATENEAGVKKHTCYDCGIEETKVIPPHNRNMNINVPYTIVKPMSENLVLTSVGITIADLLAVSNATDVLTKEDKIADATDSVATGMKFVIFYEDEIADSMTIAVLGEVNGDGLITAADARLALRNSVGLEKLDETQIQATDVNADGEITAGDARLILRASVDLEDPENWFAKF